VVVHHHHHYHRGDEPVSEWMSAKDPNVAEAEARAAQVSWQANVPTPATHEDGDVATEEEDEEEKHSKAAEDRAIPAGNDDEEPDVIPAWMSAKDPHTRVEEIRTTRIQTKPSANLEHRFASASQTVSDVAVAFSDNVFVYPGARSAFFGAEATAQDASHNALGHTVRVQVMETRAGAGDAVVGALSNGAKATALVSSASLKEMLPSMFEMAHQRLPAVFHASAYSVNEDLAILQDLSEVMAVRDAGFALLSSGTAQEAHDFAVLAHVLAEQASSPFLHFFDGARVAHQSSKVATIPAAALEKVAAKYATRAAAAVASPTSLAGFEAASHRDTPHLAAVVQQTMKQLAPTFGGKTYQLFEYVGSPSAEAVIIALGSIAHVAEQTVAGSRNIGVLKVRLIKPWSAAHLLEALPLSVRRVCVLDQSDSTPLFAEVAASFHSETALERDAVAPLLVGGRVLPCSGGFSPAVVHSVVSNLLADRPQPNFVVGGTRTASSLQVDIGVDSSAASASTRQLVIYAGSALQTQLEHASRLLADEIAAEVGFSVQHLTSSDAYAGDSGVARAELRFAPDGAKLPEAFEVANADVVIIEQALIGSVGATAAAALNRAGTLLILPEPPAPKVDGEEVFSTSRPLVLPTEVRAQLARKAGHVVVLDAKTLLERVTETAHNSVAARTASLYLALAGALQVAKAGSSTLVKNALRVANAFANDAAVTDLVSAGVARVDGYLTRHGKDFHLGFGGANASARSSGARLGGDDFDAHSLSSAGFGAISPIHPSAATPAGFVPRLAVAVPEGHKRTGLGGESGHEIVKLNHKAALTKIFPNAYETQEKLRPAEHEVFLVRLTKNKRLTPDSYNRNIFHLEFDISGTNLTYQIGDALGVFGHNDHGEIDQFIAEYGLNPNEIVAVPARGSMEKGTTEMVSVRNLLIQHLDILGKPNKKFYVALAGYATTRYEYLKLMHTGTDDNEAYKLGVNEGVTYAELLLQYKTANPTIEQIIEMVPPIKARHYSIASSMKMNPRSVHLLVVAVDWETPLGRTKFGQCTRYLAGLDPSKGDIYVTVDVQPSVLRLPPSPKQAIIMSGLGTGMAPFRAFVQERKYQKEMGIEVGPIVLYFGARHRHEEWLYGDEWDAYAAEGLVTRLGLAFSRDQKEKVYIQNKIVEDKALLGDLLGKENGFFYLCGPTWPVPAIATAISQALNPEAAARGEVDASQVEKLKQEGRYILEVY